MKLKQWSRLLKHARRKWFFWFWCPELSFLSCLSTDTPVPLMECAELSWARKANLMPSFQCEFHRSMVRLVILHPFSFLVQFLLTFYLSYWLSSVHQVPKIQPGTGGSNVSQALIVVNGGHTKVLMFLKNGFWWLFDEHNIQMLPTKGGFEVSSVLCCLISSPSKSSSYNCMVGILSAHCACCCAHSVIVDDKTYWHGTDINSKTFWFLSASFCLWFSFNLFCWFLLDIILSRQVKILAPPSHLKQSDL